MNGYIKIRSFEIIIILLVCCFLFLGIYFSFKTNKIISKRNQILEGANRKIEFLMYKEHQQNIIESLTINSKWFQDSCEWQGYLNSVSEYALCLYFSEIHCLTCVDSEIERLKSIENSIGIENILLFVDYQFEKDFQVFKRLNDIEYKTFRICKSSINSEILELQMPFYFLLDGNTFDEKNNSIIKMVFIPEKLKPSRTLEYFNVIQGLFAKVECCCDDLIGL